MFLCFHYAILDFSYFHFSAVIIFSQFLRLAFSPWKYHDRDLESYKILYILSYHRNLSLGFSAAKISIRDLRKIAQPRKKVTAENCRSTVVKACSYTLALQSYPSYIFQVNQVLQLLGILYIFPLSSSSTKRTCQKLQHGRSECCTMPWPHSQTLLSGWERYVLA